jgi:hypothetical protein
MKKSLTILSIFLTLTVFSGCNNYGTEKDFDGVQVYHTDKVTAAEADQLGAYLVKEKFANGEAKSVQLTKAGNTYQFRLVVKAGIDKDTSYWKTAKFFGSMLSAEVYDGAPVEVHLCDDHLKTSKVLVADDFGTEKFFDGVTLFHTKSITSAEVDSLGNYLVKGKFADGREKSAMITKSGNIYQFKFVVRDGVDKSPDYLKTGRLLASELSSGVFKGAPVEVVMCDEYFNTLAVLQMDDSTKKM